MHSTILLLFRTRRCNACKYSIPRRGKKHKKAR
nr:MAG TPA: zinc finger protein [Caudoviricetes sp.]